MCGIGGYFLKQGATAPDGVLQRMEQALRHRGPDGSTIMTEGQAGFCHTRLAIIDVEGGAQPFVHQHENSHCLSMANGEIYNHRELRAGLDQSKLASASDCEVLLPLWLRDGDGFTRQLRGMYAAALYDGSTGRGCLIRDPFGIKPLYVIEDERGVFFASEISALKSSLQLDCDIDPLAAASLLDRQFVIGGRTPYEGISKLAPGEVLTIENGRITGRYRDAPLGDNPDDAVRANPDDLDALLLQTVDAHQLSDVPFGMFLSGGVDSSILLALMARLRLMGQVPDHTPRLLAYTVRFDRESVADETRHARMLADHLGAEFIDATYGEDDFITSAGMAVAATDDPVADYAILPSYHLAARARADVKVILTGEGGDEFFAGYGRYRAGMRPFLPKSPTRPGPALKSGLIRADLAQRLGHALMEQSGHLPSFTERLFDRDTALARLQQHDIAEWLPDDLLTKADRCLMHNGIEGRTPFVDRHLSAYGFGLGHADKIRKRDGKYRLKAWLQENLPEAKPFTPKRGFTVPVGEWIGRHASEFAPLVSRLDSITGIIDASAVQGLFAGADRRSGLLAWRVLYFALWHQIHGRGVDPAQPVAAILAAR